jgi:hypothetical protein
LKLIQDLWKAYFLASAAALVFVAGFTVGWQKRFPTQLVEGWLAEIDDWRKYPGHNLRTRPEKFLSPARLAPASGQADPAPDSDSGQTLLTGFFNDRSGLRLVDHSGRTLHEWSASYLEVFPDPTHLDSVPKHDWDVHLHGAVLYPNGDVVFNFEWAGLVRLDRCSKVLWKLARQTHHSMELDDDGNLWIPDRKRRLVPSADMPDVPVPVWDDYLVQVSPDGKVLREISILDVFHKSGQEALLNANGGHGTTVLLPEDGDFTHLNDVEVLPAKLAAAFPMFAAGDLLVSLRNLNLVMVLSPDSGQIKWSMVGPFMRQHDPDFLPDGRIALFDNRPDRSGGKVRGGSRILSVDPATQQVDVIYGGRPDQFFYSKRMGAQQRLPNGNYLITPTEAGYVFEVNPAGDVVWSYVNRFDEQSVAWLEGATRYPANFMSTTGTQECS